MPKSTLEALASGIPIVTSDAGCRIQLYQIKLDLYVNGSYKSLASKIEKLITNPKLRKNFLLMQKNMLKIILINNVTKNIFKVYSSFKYYRD